MAVVTRPAGTRGHRAANVAKVAFVAVLAAYFVLPFVSMLRFSMQRVPMADLGWHTLFKRWTVSTLTEAFHQPGFGAALTLSLKLAGGTVFLTLLLLLPTAIYVRLRLPQARSLVELFSVLPYVVPPITLVAGVAAFFRPHAKWFLNSPYSLIPFYVLLALPFTYRSLDAGIRAIDVRTLVDASRSLGAGWVTTMFRALIPNLMSAVLSSSFLTAAVVLGEFTIANNLLRETFSVFNLRVYQSSPLGGLALALMTLVGSTALLGLFTLVLRRWTRREGTSVIAAETLLAESAIATRRSGR